LIGGPLNSLTVRFLVVIAPAFLDRCCATLKRYQCDCRDLKNDQTVEEQNKKF
jgi:hypothetical protein